MGAVTAAAEGCCSVLVLEATNKPLEKVQRSGGGRCNVTHACWEPEQLAANYPRGSRPLRGPFSRFAVADSVAWFADHGVPLVEEADGRMFPLANSSSVVVSCLKQAAKKAGVHILTKKAVTSLKYQGQKGFLVGCRDGSLFEAKKVLLATGGHPSGRYLAASLGHKIEQPVPSLFTLSLDAPFICACPGIALDNVCLILEASGQSFKEMGRVLITHWGLSGPATLRLTAFAARSLHLAGYQTELIVNWLGNSSRETVHSLLNSFRYKHATRTMGVVKPFSTFPKRFWIALLEQAECDPKKKWADFSRYSQNKLAETIVSSKYFINGRGPFGEEFVTAGGVMLGEVNLSNMESRKITGLYFAGEILDIDGVTGGFNFQHCWSSGWLAGKAIIK